MSYGAGSFMDADYKYKAGNWGVYAFFNPLYKGRLDSALNQEIDKAIKGGFTQDELAKSKSSWQEQNKTSLGNNRTVTSILQSYLLNNRDLGEYLQFEEKVRNVNLDAVNAALRKYFDKSKLVMVYGGDFEKGKNVNPAEKKGF